MIEVSEIQKIKLYCEQRNTVHFFISPKLQIPNPKSLLNFIKISLIIIP